MHNVTWAHIDPFQSYFLRWVGGPGGCSGLLVPHDPGKVSGTAPLAWESSVVPADGNWCVWICNLPFWVGFPQPPAVALYIATDGYCWKLEGGPPPPPLSLLHGWFCLVNSATLAFLDSQLHPDTQCLLESTRIDPLCAVAWRISRQ